MRKEPIYRFEEKGDFKLIGYEILADFPHLLVNSKLDLAIFKTHIEQINKEANSQYIYHLNIKLDTIKDNLNEVKNIILSSNKKDQIVLEILEDEIEEKELDFIISSIRSEGIKISIDDFGTKSSNFDRLLKYKEVIKSIKIDRVLWKNMQHVVKSMVNEIREVDIIAEKVETEEELKSLVDMGIRLFQGWYFKDNFDKVIKRSIELELNNFEEDVMFMVLKQALKLLNKSNQTKSIYNLLEYFKYTYFAYKLNIDINSSEFQKIKRHLLPERKNIYTDDESLQREIKLVNFIIGELKLFSKELENFKKEIASHITKKDYERVEMDVSEFSRKVNEVISSIKEKELEMKVLISNLEVSSIKLLSRNNLKKAILNAYLGNEDKSNVPNILVIFFPDLEDIYNFMGYNLYEKAIKSITDSLTKFLPPNQTIINYDLQTFITFVRGDTAKLESKLYKFFENFEILLDKKFVNLKVKISSLPLEKGPNETIDDLTLKVESTIYELKHF